MPCIGCSALDGVNPNFKKNIIHIKVGHHTDEIVKYHKGFTLWAPTRASPWGEFTAPSESK